MWRFIVLLGALPFSRVYCKSPYFEQVSSLQTKEKKKKTNQKTHQKKNQHNKKKKKKKDQQPKLVNRTVANLVFQRLVPCFRTTNTSIH